MEITYVKAELIARVRDVAEYLLPNGVKEQHEWRVGSLSGEKGRSLGVHLSGSKAGVWSDFASGEGGDLLDLWMATRNLSLGDAIRDAGNWLGIAQPKPAAEPKKSYTRPPKPKCAVPQGKVKDYLCEVRNIPGHILNAYKVGERGEDIIFPFLLPDGDLALAKFRKAVDGVKPQPTAKNCEPVLFGWQAIPANSREVLICEGEIDALSWAAYGWPAMSIPFGGGKAGKQSWIENEFERMERFERIYIATDMDKEGDGAAAEIASRLGRHRCYRVKMPFKDGNECLMQGVTQAVMDDAVRSAASLDPEGLRRPTDFTDAVINLFWPAPGVHVGYRTPYGKLDDKLLFRPGEVSLWSGASGAGKSQILSDCAVDWIRQGSRVCISSLEMRAPSTLKRMCKQVTGVDRPTAFAVRESLQWMAGSSEEPGRGALLLYDLIGKATPKGLIDVFDYARAKYGCDQFIIDSLMRLGIASDDYTGQEKAIFQLIEWATASNIHLHVVAHARKGGPQSGAPETEDIKGAMEIGANAFNILTVWRNKRLEDDIRKLETKLQDNGDQEHPDLKDLREKPGVIFNVAKQRNGDFEGKIGLWFDQRTYQYYSSHERKLWSRSYLSELTSVSSGEAA
jgi:twinkle protein